MGPQLMGVICEIAWNQGVDLYVDELTVKPTETGPDQWGYISNRGSDKYLREEDSSSFEGVYIVQEPLDTTYWSQQWLLE